MPLPQLCRYTKLLSDAHCCTKFKQKMVIMLMCIIYKMFQSTVKSCESIHAVWMRCGSNSGDRENRKHRKYECLIPFKRCGSRMACGGIAEFFSHLGASRATAAEPPQQKVGVVCIPAIFCFVFVTLDSYQQLQYFKKQQHTYCADGLPF